MIYVMGTGPSAIVKIGTAMNPLQRLKQIQAGHPEPLKVLLAHAGNHATESYLHRYFSERRVSAREWFDFTDSDAVQQVTGALKAQEMERYEDQNGGIPHVFTPPIPVNRTQPGHLSPAPIDLLDEDATPVKIYGPDHFGRYSLEIGGDELPDGIAAAEVNYLLAAHFDGIHDLTRLRDQLTAEIERVEKLHANVGGEIYRRQRDGTLQLVDLVGKPIAKLEAAS